jgi:hypothetical protein
VVLDTKPESLIKLFLMLRLKNYLKRLFLKVFFNKKQSKFNPIIVGWFINLDHVGII